jgi:hypothetical protein
VGCAHDCLETVTGFVVVALGMVVVVVVVVGSAADAELDDDPDGEAVVVGEVLAELPDVDAPEGCWVADEWAVVSVAANSPSPTALAIAATPMVAVVRRTRDNARSRAPAAGWLGRSIPRG